jgi:hypothetical protein
MKMSIVLAAGLVMSMGAAFAQESKPATPTKPTTPTTTPTTTPATTPAVPGVTTAKTAPKQPEAPADWSKMSPEDMMKAWEAANPITPEHQKLAMDLVGEWNATTTCWMTPGGEPTTSTGKAKFTAVPGMQLRWISLDYTGEMMGKPFKGAGFFGYNSTTGKYESVWMDSFSNGMFTETGTKDSTGSYEWKGTCVDPMSKQPKSTRSTWTFKDPSTLVCSMFENGPDGKEFKSFEITYARITAKKELPAVPPASR